MSTPLGPDGRPSVPGSREPAPGSEGKPVPFALGADGKPVAQEVPADFAAQQEAAASAQLTPEEVAEFRALRQAKKDADAQALADAEAAAAKLQPFTHFVHLADGQIVDGSTIATHVDNGHGPLPVTGTFLKPEFVTFPQ
jgi:hypothetical protein